jgi:acyl-coenzyme A synthetase/AMP-(fatty) acid ligase
VRRAYYRTGDRVGLGAGGYEFLGRVDDQVQIQGHRVELGEVEAALRAEDGVSEAAAVPVAAPDGTNAGLFGVVTGDGLDPERLVRGLRDRLPAYAVPGRVVPVEAMPLNANGKLDRAELRRSLGAATG